MSKQVFVNASTARTNARNAGTIHSEVRDIETEILANVDQGLLYANVTSNTTMTDSNVYYYAWYGVQSNATVVDQITEVKSYFEHLGYGVQILANPATNVNITWNITW